MLFMSAYDADEPEGSGKSSYASKKTFLTLVGGTLCFLLLLYPVLQWLRKDGEKARCSQNLKNLYEASQFYYVDNNDHLPPTFYPDQVGSPALVKGIPVSWAVLIQGGIKSADNFRCPSALPDELSTVVGLKATPITLSYGMYGPMDMQSVTNLLHPESTILFAETTAHGASHTYNPAPFKYADGSVLKDDGFVIGFDSGNEWIPETYRNAKFATRLAFPNTSKEEFSYTGPARHRQGVQIVFADGHLGVLTPEQAAVERRSRRDDDLSGLWSTR